jgi:site-specific recombinase XerD
MVTMFRSPRSRATPARGSPDGGGTSNHVSQGEVGIVERKPAPILRSFGHRFIEAIKVRCAGKPRTIAFYTEKLTPLLEFEPLASSRLDKIDEALVESYIQERRKRVAPATVNRQLATLRRLLRLAYDWKEIDRVPRIRLLPGEREREYVLSREREDEYLKECPQPSHDLALLMLDAGLRIGEALILESRDVCIDPVGDAEFGFVHVRDGKSKYAKRNVPLTAGVRIANAAFGKYRKAQKQRWGAQSQVRASYLRYRDHVSASFAGYY